MGTGQNKGVPVVPRFRSKRLGLERGPPQQSSAAMFSFFL
jgi:hypothetical protein